MGFPRSKYRARAVIVDGRRFHSGAEALRYGQLCLLERAGAITELECQPRFPLLVNGVLVTTYVADFRYRDQEGLVRVEDVKGFPTPVYRLKAKLARALGLAIEEIAASNRASGGSRSRPRRGRARLSDAYAPGGGEDRS